MNPPPYSVVHGKEVSRARTFVEKEQSEIKKIKQKSEF